MRNEGSGDCHQYMSMTPSFCLLCEELKISFHIQKIYEFHRAIYDKILRYLIVLVQSQVWLCTDDNISVIER